MSVPNFNSQISILSTPRTILYLSVLVFSSLFLFCSCQKKAPVRAKEIPEAVKSYVYAYSTGVVSKVDAVKVRFSGAVATPEMIGQEADDDILEFVPSTRGTAYWEDDHTIRFEPKNGWESGGAYIGRVDLTEVFDNLQEEAQSFEFDFLVKGQGLKVEVDAISPYSDDDLSVQTLTGHIQTNDVADEKAIEELFEAKQNRNSLPLIWEHAADGTYHQFTINDIKRSTKRSEVYLSWDGDEIGTDQEGELKVSIPALGDFEVTNAKVMTGENQVVELHFSDPLMPNQNLNGLIGVRDAGGQFAFNSQQVSLNYTIDGNKVLVNAQRRLAGKQTFEVRPGIQNIEGASLSKPAVWNLDFEQEQPMVRLVGRGVILPTSEEGLVLPFEAVSLEAVEVEVFKVYDNNILQFLQTSELDGNNTYELRRVGRVVRRQMVPLQGLNPTANTAVWSRYALDLNQLFEADPNAIYQVRIGFRPEYALRNCGEPQTETALKLVNQQQHLDEDGEIKSFWGDYYGIDGYYQSFRWQHRENPCFPAYYNSENFVSTNVMASNLGITAKSGRAAADGEYPLFVAVADLRSTDEVEAATVEFYDFQQQLISTAVTNGDGIVETVLSRKPFLIVAKTETDRGYLKTGNGNALSLSRFDVAGTEKQKGLKGFLYGDRGVWRPGDSLFLNFILEDKEARLPSNYPISFELTDSRGQLQYQTVTTKNVENLYPLTVATTADAPTGNWLAVVKAGGATFTKNLKIETVKPNRLKIDLDFGVEQLSASREPQSVQMEVKWLHGAAGKDLKTIVEADLNPVNTSFEGFKDFEFDDPSRTLYADPFVIYEGQTSADGKAEFQAKLYNKNTPVPGMLKANFRARAFEKGGDFSFKNISVPYSPYSSYAGITINKNKYGEKRVNIGENSSIKVAAVDERGQPLRQKNLSVGLYRVNWRWWWDTENAGVSQYNSSNHFNAMESTGVVTDTDGTATYDVNVPTWGRYLVRVCDTQSGHCSGDFFYAGYPWYGDDGNSIAQRQEAAMMTFSTSKDKYEVGDDIEITVPAGEDGRVLVTLETGDRVIRSFWEDVDQGENEIDFEATREMSPTVYVHVSLIQPHGQTKNDLPIRMYGVMPVDVEDTETVLKPSMVVADELRPEQTFTVSVEEENDEPMAYTIAVVDEGLLGLTNFKTPDPHASLYAREALGVRTWDVYDYVLGAYGGELERILSIGGDGEGNAPGSRKNANRFQPVVLHAGPFYLDGGKKEHRFTMPNYVGEVRVMLVAANEDAAYGNVEKVVPVKKPLMALATLPRVLGPGESLRLPVSIFAMTDKIKEVDVQIAETTGLVQVTGGQTKNLRFNGVGEKMAYFNLEVGETAGIAKFKINAVGAGEKASQEIEIDIRNPNPYQTSVAAGVLEQGAVWEQELTTLGMPGSNTGYLEVSSIPPINLGKRLNYLLRYPHGCIEQTTSAGFPQLYVDRMIEMSDQEKAIAKQNVQATIAKLTNFQQSSGGFSYWPGQEYNDWGTTYAGHFLLEAKAAGYVVSQNMIDRFVTFQSRAAKQWRASNNSRSNDLLQAYRLYTLSLAGKPAQAAMNRLRERPRLSNEARWRLAAAYAINGKQEIGQKLIDGLTEEAAYYDHWGDSYGSPLRDEAMILETLILLGNETAAMSNMLDVAKQLGDNYWYSTQSTAFALLAIGKFLGNNDVSQPIKFEYQLPNGTLVDAGSQTPFMQIKIPDNLLNTRNNTGRSVQVTNTGEGVLFTRMILSGQPLIGEELAANKDVRMSVEYKDASGNVLNPASLIQGTDFIAEITVNHPSTRLIAYDEMALTQIFPSGWEIMNARLSNFDEYANTTIPEYQDVRDDRVYTYFDLQKGETQIYRIRLNAAYPGRYYLPAVNCTAMYDEGIYARTAGQWVNVVSAMDL